MTNLKLYLREALVVLTCLTTVMIVGFLLGSALAVGAWLSYLLFFQP